MIAIRAPLNQLRGDTSLFSLGSFNVSVLGLWTMAFILLCAMRLARAPRAAAAIRGPIGGFLAVVVLFGIPRILIPNALATDVLLFVQFFLTLLVARFVIEDVGIDYLIKRVVTGLIVLLVMHATARAWAPQIDMFSDAAGESQEALSIGSYLGAFQSKHIAAASFFAVLPFLICGMLRKRRSLATLLIAPTTIFMVLTMQRTSVVSITLFVLACLVISRQVRLLVPTLLLATIVVASIPSDSFEKFVETKIEEELEDLRTGDIEAVGANRIAIVLLAENWFFDDFSLVEQFIGRGTAQAHQLHLLVVGNLSYAHIEVIELVIDYGVIGLGLAFLILIRIGSSKLRELRILRTPERVVGMAMLVVVFAQMFYAMPLQDGGTSALLAFWLFPTLPSPAPGVT